MVLADANVLTRMPLVAALTHDDSAGIDLLAAEIVAHERGAKVISFKKRRRKNSRRKRGYRDEYTLIRITEILTDGKKPTVEARKKSAPKAKAPAAEGDEAEAKPAKKAAAKKPAAKAKAPAKKPAAKPKAKK